LKLSPLCSGNFAFRTMGREGKEERRGGGGVDFKLSAGSSTKGRGRRMRISNSLSLIRSQTGGCKKEKKPPVFRCRKKKRRKKKRVSWYFVVRGKKKEEEEKRR